MRRRVRQRCEELADLSMETSKERAFQAEDKTLLMPGRDLTDFPKHIQEHPPHPWEYQFMENLSLSMQLQ